ncbi:MAG TPA: hypothetical protein VM120_19035 [Bryobacteraceae bacterium]|nr:hypothetical protein [Bryobacteraceae bacterium]
MKRLRTPVFAATLVLAAALIYAQQRPIQDDPPRLPNGRSQSEEILKADHEKTLKDAGELFRLAEDLKIELEKNDRHILSVGMLKKTEEIEKLAKRIRQRLKRF